MKSICNNCGLNKSSCPCPKVSSPQDNNWEEEERNTFYLWTEGYRQGNHEIANYWLSRMSQAINKAQVEGEKHGWQQGQLHGEAIGRQEERSRLIALAEEMKKNIEFAKNQTAIRGHEKWLIIAESQINSLKDFITCASKE